MTVARKQLIYDLHPCKSPFRPPLAFKFDPVKFSPSMIRLIITLSPDVFEDPFCVAQISTQETVMSIEES